MANISQIGAVIGIEGWKEYKNQIASITNATKQLASEGKLLESEYKNQTKSVSDLAKQKLNLQGQIAKTGEKLATQRAVLSQVVEEYKKGGDNAKVLEQDMLELATQVNDTEKEFYDLENALNSLPADSLMGKLELIKENIAKNDSEMKKWGETLSDVGSKLTQFLTVPIFGGFVASTKAAVDWESALNGVRKTVEATPEEIDAIGVALKQMALETGQSSVDLAGLAQIAGQLGISTDNIVPFVKTITDLGIATDLTAEEAATALARIINITGDSADSYEKLGGVIVHLGNNMATTEPEIVALANRMASTASIVGLTTPEIFALSSALSSVGITAEAGGSTVAQALVQLEGEVSAFSTGAENNLEKIASVSGVTASQFAETWKNEPVRAFEMFVTGLGNLGEESETVSSILDELSMDGIRESNMLKALAQAQREGTDTTQLFTYALDLAEQAYTGINEKGEEFNALTQEANVRYGESATSFANLKESVTQLGQAFGEVLLPYVIPVVQKITEIITAISQMDEGTKKAILTVAGIVAAIGPVIAVIGKILIFASNLKVALTTLRISSGKILIFASNLKVALTTLGISFGTIGTSLLSILTPIALVIAGIVAIYEVATHWDSIKAFCAGVIDVVGALGQFVWELIKTAATLWVTTVKGLLEGILYTVATVMNTIAIQIRVTIQNIMLIVSTIINTIKGLLTAFFQFMTGDTKGAMETLKSTFSSAGENIKNIFRNCVNGVKDIWNGIVTAAKSWGKDLMDNLISGITSKMSAIGNAVSNVANKVRSYLHFSEPDIGPLSDFHTWMPDMMKGLAKGIDDNSYLVDNAINRVAESLSMNPGSVNYGGVVINLNVPQGANGQQLVSEIETELANRTIRRKAVFA